MSDKNTPQTGNESATSERIETKLVPPSMYNVLYVTEKANAYYSYQDCPENRAVAELTVVGYNVTEEGYQVINDSELLTSLYQQIIWNIQCVVDFDSDEYYHYDVVPNESEEINCYTNEQYNLLLEQRNAE